MQKAYSRITWENYPSENTPLNDINLNKMDAALNTVDNRVVDFDTTKSNQSDLLLALKNVTYDTETGLFTFTWFNGTTRTIDLNVEKIPVSFSMSEDGVITMTTADGTEFTADVSTLIKTYSFANTSEITWNVTTDEAGNKTVTPALVEGGITADKLQPNFLADCNQAKSDAEGYKNIASTKSLISEGYAVGQQNGVDVGPDSEYYHNNAKYYNDQAQSASITPIATTTVPGRVMPDGTTITVEENGAIHAVDQTGELKTKVGNAALTTTAQDLSGAVNELNDDVASLDTNKQNKTDDTLTTSAKTIVGAINEVNAKAPIVDSEMSTTSENPLQNKVITEEVNSINQNLTELGSSVDELSEKIETSATGNYISLRLPNGRFVQFILSDGGSGASAIIAYNEKMEVLWRYNRP